MGHNRKTAIIGNFFINISSIWFKDFVDDVHKFTNWIFNDYKKAGYPVEVDDRWTRVEHIFKKINNVWVEQENNLENVLTESGKIFFYHN